MKLIVGLGNPGKEYEKTRHNVGFIYLDRYIEKNDLGTFKEKFKSLYIKENIKDEAVFFQKPLTFMNLSGEAIKELASFFKIDTSKDLMVIYDDMDLEVGSIKIKKNGSSAGHNGIKSIISHVGEEFVRVKIGIGKSKDKDTIAHVLGNFSKEEMEVLDSLDKQVFRIINSFISSMDIEKMMSKYNIKIKKKNTEVE